MSKKYYELRLAMDEERKGTWTISDYPSDFLGNEVKPWELFSCMPWVGAEPLTVKLISRGKPLEFDMLRLEVPMVNQLVYQAIKQFLPESTQCIPTKIYCHKDELNYIMLNVMEMPDCLDLEHSKLVPWDPEEYEPWRNPLGKMFICPAIYKNAVQGRHLFRLKNWGSNRLIVSDEVRFCLTDLGVRYLRYVDIIMS